MRSVTLNLGHISMNTSSSVSIHATHAISRVTPLPSPPEFLELAKSNREMVEVAVQRGTLPAYEVEILRTLLNSMEAGKRMTRDVVGNQLVESDFFDREIIAVREAIINLTGVVISEK